MSGWNMGRSKLHRRYYDQKCVGSYGGVATLQIVVPDERDVKMMAVDAGCIQVPQTGEASLQMALSRGWWSNQQWKANLVDMSRFKWANDETTFLLTIIDMF